MSVLDELGDFVEAAGVATGTELYLGSMPDTPDDLLCIYVYPGNAPEYVQELETPKYEKPQIQVVARAIAYVDAEHRIEAAWSLLSAIHNQTLNGTYYRSVRPNGSPALLRRDTNDRILLFFNASVDKEVTLVTVS